MIIGGGKGHGRFYASYSSNKVDIGGGLPLKKGILISLLLLILSKRKLSQAFKRPKFPDLL